MSTGQWIVLAVIVMTVGGIVYYYNLLVRLRARWRNAFAQIDVQLQRRHDLIPNLVEAVKASISHERETLEGVMQARNQATQAQQNASHQPGEPGAMQALSKAEGLLGRALGGLYAVVENYPELRANETITELMEELTSTENRVGYARQAFNDAVTRYHETREQFPSNLIAGFFGFKDAALYQPEDAEARKPVSVKLN